MPETALVEHIERHGILWHPFLRCKGKPCLGIDKPSNEPRGCASVHPWSGPGYPDSASVVSWVNLRCFCRADRHACGLSFLQQFRDALLQRTVEEIYVDDVLKTATQTAESADSPIGRGHGKKVLQLTD